MLVSMPSSVDRCDGLVYVLDISLTPIPNSNIRGAGLRNAPLCMHSDVQVQTLTKLCKALGFQVRGKTLRA